MVVSSRCSFFLKKKKFYKGVSLRRLMISSAGFFSPALFL